MPWNNLTLAYVSEGSLLTRPHVEIDIDGHPNRLSLFGGAGDAVAARIKEVQGLTGPGPNYFFKSPA